MSLEFFMMEASGLTNSLTHQTWSVLKNKLGELPSLSQKAKMKMKTKGFIKETKDDSWHLQQSLEQIEKVIINLTS